MKKRINTNSAARAVIYARYSSANQRDCSIEQQVEKCRELAAREGVTVIEIYADRAVSGKTDRRPNFQRMMKDASLRQFDVVLAWKSNRMGRNMLQAMMNEEQLRSNGIRTIYAEEDFDDTAAGRFALRNMMNVNQFYSENMAEDISRGLMDNASKCMSNGSLPLGYKTGKDQKVVLDEAEAAIVQEIFTRVSCYEPFIDIARDLNRRGIKTKKGAEWGRSSFHTICRNERYRGIYIYRDIRVEGGMPRIVSDELFYKVQEVLKVKKNPQGRRKRSGYEEYLLTGKLYCGHCGSPMTGIAGTSKTGAMHYYYTCQKRRTDHSCDKKAVRRDQIEKAVAIAIQQLLLTDENIQMMADETMAYNARTEIKYRLQSLQQQLYSNETSTANIMKAIEMGIITDTTKARLLALEQEHGQLLAKIDTAKAEMVPINREDFVSLLDIYRTGDVNNKKYLAALFDTFLVRVDLYDDHFKITFDPTGGKMPVDIPIGAEDSPESPGDSPESSDFEASPQDAEKFVLALHNRTKEKHLETQAFRCFSFCCTAAFTAPPYRYAPFASRYSIRHSSTLPPCFQAAKPLPGLPAVRPWLYCRCPPHQGADQGLCSGSAGWRWPCAACRPRRSRCVHGRWSRRTVSAAAGSVSTSLQTSRRLGRMPISGAPATGCARNTVYSW